jgi:hypothetical protein
LLAAGVIGWDDALIWATNVLPASRQFYVSQANLSLIALGSLIASPVLGGILTLSAWALLCVLMYRRPGNADRVLVTGAAGALLLSPLGWSYYYVLLIPCLPVLARYLDVTNRRHRMFLEALLLASMMWPSQLGSAREEVLHTPIPWLNHLLTLQTSVLWLDLLLNFVPTIALIVLIATAFARIR